MARLKDHPVLYSKGIIWNIQGLVNYEIFSTVFFFISSSLIEMKSKKNPIPWNNLKSGDGIICQHVSLSLVCQNSVLNIDETGLCIRS